MSGEDEATVTARREAIMNRAFALGVVTHTALALMAVFGGEAAATAAVAAVGGVTAALVRLAARCLQVSGEPPGSR